MGALIEAFGLGVLSAGSPCLLPLYPGFVAYLAANHRVLAGRRAAGVTGLVVLAGIRATMIGFGLAATALAIGTGRLLVIIVPLADVAIIATGVLLIIGRNPFARLPGISVAHDANPYRQAFVYGLVLGPLVLPCAGAFVVALFGIAIGLPDLAARIAESVAFGLGFGLPLVLLSMVAAARGQAIVRLILRFYGPIERGAGVVLVAIGGLQLAQSLPTAALFVG